MEISTLTLKLIILLTPGAIATMIYRRLCVTSSERSDFMFVISSILLGLFSYLILQILIVILHFFCNTTLTPCDCFNYGILKTFSDIGSSQTIPYSEVIYSSGISVLLGLLITKIDNDKILNKFAKKYNISNKYGEDNLYSHFLNSPDIEWVYVRDLANSLTYLGFIKFFSENEDFKELVLEQVIVYNYPDSEELYQLERIYLCLPKDKIIIEQAINANYGEEASTTQSPTDNINNSNPSVDGRESQEQSRETSTDNP